MAPAPGSRLGPYELVAPIGAGGMGQVWSARDTRLDRMVAIKFSAEQFTERFEREARNIAALNHPNICTIFDVGPDYLVMELIQGPTLAERIDAGAIPLEETLGIARQVAEALEAAHEKGIIHRDLKPANIKLTPEGKAKVLDFGLAKARDPESASGDPAMSPTLTISATRAGMIIGTAGYMSPEQARGKAVDRRADIWSFGVVLYEMICGRQLYSGELASDLLAAVILKDPDWEAPPKSTPSKIRDLLMRCLRKDPQMRLRDIGDARVALEEYLAKPDAPAVVLPPGQANAKAPMWLVAVAGLLAAALAGLAALHFTEKPQELSTVRFDLPAPQRASFGTGMALSPNGKLLVFSNADKDGRPSLWLRPLDSLTAQSLPETEEGAFPFWSPDSRFIGFFASGKLKKIDATGGPPTTLCEYSNTAIGGTWNRDGVIVFGTNSSGLYRVPQAGGSATPLTKLSGERRENFHGSPWFLPDQKRLLFFINCATASGTGIFVTGLDGKSRKQLMQTKQGGQYVPPIGTSTVGHLLFLRDTTLMAQPLDPQSLDPAGDAFPIAEQVGYNISNPFFAVSSNGVLAYRGGGAGGGTQLGWFDRIGKLLNTIGTPGRYLDISLSPDDKHLALSRGQNPDRDLWTFDLVQGVPSRFTFDPANETHPIWSPDGSKIFFASDQSLRRKASSGTGTEEPLSKEAQGRPYDVSSDGKYLIYSAIERAGQTTDLYLLADPLNAGPDTKPRPFLTSPFSESEGQFCPVNTGGVRWIAYVSNESGKHEVYVQAFSENAVQGSGKFQISSNGGFQPRWRRDAKELFYLQQDGQLMSVQIKTAPQFEHGIPKALFQTQIRGSDPGLANNYRYAVSADGNRFLIDGQEQRESEAPITVVLNWLAGVKR